MPQNTEENKATQNKPCIMCDRPETEDNMIGCQNENPICENWLHNSCDSEVKDDKTAKEIIDVYFCPPCRESGNKIIPYQNTLNNETKDKIPVPNQTTQNQNKEANETPQKSISLENNDIEIAEDALSSPILTPGQRTPTNPNILNESDHEFSQLIKSISDEIKIGSEEKMKSLMEKNEEKMKEIVEKIRRVSISKEDDKEKDKSGQIINKNIDKPTKLPKRKKRKLATKSRTEILKEYDKLNNQYDHIENENIALEKRVDELEKKTQGRARLP